MELWIRSQNREKLVKANEIKYEEYKNVLMNYPIDAIIINDKIVQEYKTKERALEVLDEIQELIKPKIIATQYQCAIEDNKKTEFNLIMNPVKTEIQELSTVVYQMPEE